MAVWAGRARPDVQRAWVPALAAMFAIVAPLIDPGEWAQAAALIVPVAAFAVWAWWPRLPIVVLTVVVIPAVVVSQLGGTLEPGMFMIALLASIGRWETSRWWFAVSCAAAVLTPVLVVVLQPADNRLNWPMWVIGIAFAATFGRVVQRQERLSRQLTEARRQLAEQAQAEGRRRIARDIHDVVAHGLAGVLLQVASARHVLRRDVDAAEHALNDAEAAGRRALNELRGTMAVLRSDGDAGNLPLPDFGRLDALIDSARNDGLDVRYSASGDLDSVGPDVGMALYRIAQEALHNALKHAPRAATSVTVAVSGESIALEVETVGRRSRPVERDRPHYGVLGMRERAAAVGGELRAGPTPGGWQVRCHVPRGAR